MESTLRVTGPLGSSGIPGTPVRKARRKKAQVMAGEVSVAKERARSVSAVEESVSSYGYVRTAGVEALSDIVLVEQTLSGKQESFAVLVERYKDAVQNLAYRMLSNVTEAEDVTQEVFVRAYTQLATYKPAHKFSTWLLSIASHLAIDQLRRRRFLALPLEDVPFLEWITDLGAGPEQSALAGEQQDEIQAYLQRLHSKYRSVIVLRYWYDFSYEEIASMLKLTPTLVKARLHRARELLARYMKENQLQEEEQADVLARG
ncbi:MAG TPA: sigma-70 family RNA polymerase sigma factor [Ktedonobacteraceae bacterium]